MSGEYTFNGFFIYYDAVCKHTPTTRPSGWYYYMKRWVLNPFLSHCIKSVHIRSFSDPHFPAFGLNTERYFVSLRSFRILPECWKKKPRKTPNTDTFHALSFPIYISIPYWWKKEPVKSGQFFSGDQYFSPTNNFTRLKLKPIKNFYQLFFLLNKNQITEIFKKVSALLYHNLIEWRWVGKGS